MPTTFKNCSGCGNKLPSTDGHSLCLFCLGEGHNTSTCPHCRKFSARTRKFRAFRLKEHLTHLSLSAQPAPPTMTASGSSIRVALKRSLQDASAPAKPLAKAKRPKAASATSSQATVPTKPSKARDRPAPTTTQRKARKLPSPVSSDHSDEEEAAKASLSEGELASPVKEFSPPAHSASDRDQSASDHGSGSSHRGRTSGRESTSSHHSTPRRREQSPSPPRRRQTSLSPPPTPSLDDRRADGSAAAGTGRPLDTDTSRRQRDATAPESRPRREDYEADVRHQEETDADRRRVNIDKSRHDADRHRDPGTDRRRSVIDVPDRRRDDADRRDDERRGDNRRRQDDVDTDRRRNDPDRVDTDRRRSDPDRRSDMGDSRRRQPFAADNSHRNVDDRRPLGTDRHRQNDFPERHRQTDSRDRGRGDTSTPPVEQPRKRVSKSKHLVQPSPLPQSREKEKSSSKTAQLIPKLIKCLLELSESESGAEELSQRPSRSRIPKTRAPAKSVDSQDSHRDASDELSDVSSEGDSQRDVDQPDTTAYSDSPSPTDDYKTFVDLVNKMIVALEIDQPAPPKPSTSKIPLFQKLHRNTPVPARLPLSDHIRDTVQDNWASPSSAQPTSRKLDNLYKLDTTDCSWISTHPAPNSLIVHAAQDKAPANKKPAPAEQEGKKIDMMARKTFSSSALLIKIANFTSFLAAYNNHLWDHLDTILDDLPDEKREDIVQLMSEAEQVALQQAASARHVADVAGKVMATSIALRRHSWLRSADLSTKERQDIEDMPFDGQGLFNKGTDDSLDHTLKARFAARKFSQKSKQLSSKPRHTSWPRQPYPYRRHYSPQRNNGKSQPRDQSQPRSRRRSSSSSGQRSQQTGKKQGSYQQKRNF